MRRRLTGARVPAAFFAGLALISWSVAELARAPAVFVRSALGDLALPPGAARLATLEALRGPLDIADRDVLVMWLAGCFALAVVGVALVAKQRGALGALALVASGLGALGLLSAIALDLRTASPFADEARSAASLTAEAAGRWALVFVAGLTTAIGAAWLISHRKLGLAALAGAGIAGGMMGAALFDASRWSTARWSLEPILVAPFAPFVALLAVGLALSVSRPLWVSRAVSLGALLLGVLLCVPAVAVAHDGRVALASLQVPRVGNLTGPAFRACEPVGEGNDVLLGEHRVRIRQLNPMPMGDEPGALNIVVATPHLWDLEQVLRLHRADGGRSSTLVRWRLEPGPLWSRASTRVRECGLTLELSDDGIPLGEFRTVDDLIRAGDAAGGRFAVRVTSSD